MKREPTLHGLAEKPRVRRVSSRCSRSTIVKSRPNFCASSSCHCSSIEAGAATTIIVDATPQQHLSNDKAGFDSLAKTDVVSDQQIDAWQFQRLGQRKKLIGIQADARPKRRLEQLSVRRRGGAPFGRAQVGAEALGPFEAFGQKGRPVIWVEDLRLQFGCECELDRFALRIVFAGNEMQRLHRPGLFRPLNNPRFAAGKNEISRLWNSYN